MIIHRIFEVYKSDKRRKRDLEWSVASLPQGNERTLLEQDLFAVSHRIAHVDAILVSLPIPYREALYYRYVYTGRDWEWQRIMNMYVSRRTLYRVLARARDAFMNRWRN